MIQGCILISLQTTTYLPSPLIFSDPLPSYTLFKVATFQEEIQTIDLPHPLSQIIFTYATLYDLVHNIGLIQFHSIEVLDTRGERIFYVRRLQALSTSQAPARPTITSSGTPPPPLSPAPRTMTNVGRGYNSFHGFDTGPPPPPGLGFPGQGHGGPFQSFPGFSFMPPISPQMPMFAPPPQFGYGFASYPNFGFQSYGQAHSSIQPVTDGGIPSIHLRNHTGGVGLPPGYDYAFPKEHCKIHVFKTPNPPWQMSVSAWDPGSHVKLLVPCNTTVKELMQNLGCTNEDAKKNKMYEVQEAGQGKWVRGLSINGDDKDRVKKIISDLGWDKSRTGHPGQRPVVWLWCTKD